MRKKQQEIIKFLGVKPTINAREEIDERITFLKEYILKSRTQGFVLGISGGQDSTLAGRLCQLACEALRKEGKDATFIAVRLPYHTQKDEEDAQEALSFIQPDKTITFDIGTTVDAFSETFEKTTKQEISDFNKGNVKARIRMVTQYAIAGEHNFLVVGTDHAAENVTGFFTKYGDGGADVLPLFGLNKRQGKQLLKELGAPVRLYEKIPTADLLDDKPGQSDEAELGMKYDDIDDYLEGKDVPEDVAASIEKRYMITEHKRQLPATILDDWWK